MGGGGPAKRLPLTDEENLGVGCVGGIIETYVHMPLVTYKICKQEGRPFPKGAAGWYRGVTANAASLAPITATQMVTNGILERFVTGGSRKMTNMETTLCAMGAGSVSALLYGPLDLVVIHQQKMQLGVSDTVKAIVKEHGGLMLFRAFHSTVVREAIYTAGYLALAPIAKAYLQSVSPMLKENELASSIIGSCIGGTVAGLLTHPVDTGKTMMQADLTGAKHKNATQAIRHMYAAEGVKGLYKGGMARTGRLCGAFFIVSNIREFVIQKKSADAEEA